MEKSKLSRAKRARVLICIVILALLAALTAFDNLTVGATHYEVESDRLPEPFDGFRIAHISDLHNARFGKNNSQLVELLRGEQPDIIAITGDLVDSHKTDIDTAVELIEQIVEIAPCYYVTGNHEAQLGKRYLPLEQRLLDAGVVVLHDEAAVIERDGAELQLLGLDDPAFNLGAAAKKSASLGGRLSALAQGDGFKLLLSHRPEHFETYVGSGIDLALCGHAHGGQVRLPFIGGLYAPNQGFFPEYDAGVYSEAQTTMVLSRGVGNSAIPVRINDRPEIVLIDLRATSSAGA